MVRTQRRPPVIWIWAGIVSVVVIVVAVMFWVFSLSPSTEIPDNSRKVPSLAGQTYEQAQGALLDLDLTSLKAEESSATVPVDQVIRTDPPSGTIVVPKEVITVYVSTGAETAAVPDVLNQPIEAAQAAITAAEFTPGTVTSQDSPTVAADLVLSTDPAGASEQPLGTTVNFFVSNGMVTLDDLRGQSLSAATDLLRGATLLLVPVPEPDYDCSEKPGSPVTQQSLAPGQVPQKSEVTLTYCAG